ncbi:MAG: cardiolipin synthase [Desulfobulbaceae bacterium]|nr:cardiolipin synthase [Desulfobulbaceae bacterium]
MIWTIVITALLSILLTFIGMNFALPEKKLQHKLSRLYGMSDPQFSREMGVMLGPAVTTGNRIESLNNGDEIFPAMLEAIHTAQKTITFETYIYWTGEIGRQFAEALAERAQAGVRVQVLLDWVGSLKMDDDLLDLIEKNGVHVYRYRPLRWYHLNRLNNRTHRKLLVVDGKIAFTGGVGIADQWLGNAENEDYWRDIHFRMEGPVVSQVQAAFNDNWIKATGEVLHGENFFPAQEEQGETSAHMFISSPAGGSENMQLMYMLAITAAEKSIDLQAVYFVPDELITKALLAAVERGVHVRIMVPGKHIDQQMVRFVSKALWGDFLKKGVEIYIFEPTMMHNKMLIIDQRMVSVGSTNFDMRSFHLNDEASLNIYDTDFAKATTRIFEQDIDRCRHYDYAMWHKRPFRQKVLEKIFLPFKSQL